MTAEEAIAAVVDVIARLRETDSVNVFLFGSVAEGSICWSDIDILIVCKRQIDGSAARKALAELCGAYPIDLTVMTVEEEAELDFIRSERCRLLISLGSEAP